MKIIKKAIWQGPEPYAGMARAPFWLGCFLLVLSAISILTMPVTQYLWTWDRFLHGGHDFEFSALILSTVVSLVLVLAKQSKQCADSLFLESHIPRFDLPHHASAAVPSTTASLIFQAKLLIDLPSSIYGIPLQV